MSYQQFHDYFPDLAERETRVITLFHDRAFPGVPPGEYALLESFCNEKACDCRRVMWMVVSDETKSPVAVVAYGWGSAKFYKQWYGSNDPAVIREMQGPVLNLASPQAPYAPAILDMLTKLVLKDKAYLERVQRHYTMFRNRIETGSRFLA